MKHELSEFEWGYDPNMRGFLLDEISNGWLVINVLSSDFRLNGFAILNKNAVDRIVKMLDTDIYARFAAASNLMPDDPLISVDKISSFFSHIRQIWKVIGIYTISRGFDDLEIGVLVDVCEGHVAYKYVSIDGEVCDQVTRIRFEDILAVSFGGFYESGIRQVIDFELIDRPISD